MLRLSDTGGYTPARIVSICAAAYTHRMTPVMLRLKELRKLAGLSQEALAAAVGVRQATISDLENDRSRRIELDLIDRLAKVLKVDPGELLAREPKKRGSRD